MKIIKADEFKKLEEYTINNIGIPREVLEDHKAMAIIKNIDLNLRQSFAVICGSNENGSIGLALARILDSLDKKVYVFFLGNSDSNKANISKNLEILKRLDINIKYLNTMEELNDFSKGLNRVNTLIDCLTGIDYDSVFNGGIEYVIKEINRSRIYTISADIPSGMDYDSGACRNICVRPDLVVTFEYLKAGLNRLKGLDGYDLVVERTGIPSKAKKYILNEG